MNKVILIGRLGRDPEIRYAQSGTAICNFSLATTERYGGEKKTEWHNLVAFGKLAEICGEYLFKGSQTSIVGRLQTSKWEKDGQTHYKTEILISEMEMLDSKSNTNQKLNDNFEEDDIPF